MEQGLRSKKILVVDDDVDLAKVLATGLKQKGYDVAVANHGEGAVEMAKTFHPHLVLLDLGMPGLAGDIAGLRMRSENGNWVIPIVALTGHGDSLSQVTTRAMGFADHILKPYDLEDLCRRLEKLLANPPASPKEAT